MTNKVEVIGHRGRVKRLLLFGSLSIATSDGWELTRRNAGGSQSFVIPELSPEIHERPHEVDLLSRSCGAGELLSGWALHKKGHYLSEGYRSHWLHGMCCTLNINVRREPVMQGSRADGLITATPRTRGLGSHRREDRQPKPAVFDPERTHLVLHLDGIVIPERDWACQARANPDC